MAPPPADGPRLDKRLGQHHLVDGAICRPLIDFLRPDGEAVLEIGPGGGILTRELLAAGAARVVAWEIDPAWAARLAGDLEDSRLEVVVGDALCLDWPDWHRPGRPRFVAGNLPYNVATPILERMLTGAPEEAIDRAAFLLQGEVAERLAAVPGDDAYGYLSVLVAAYAKPRLLGRVRPGSFRPPPKVESAFIGLAPHAPPLAREEMPRLLRTVSLAFAQRRKTLRNALGAGWGKRAAAKALAAAGIPPTARAEEIGLDGFVALHRAHHEERAAS